MCRQVILTSFAAMSMKNIPGSHSIFTKHSSRRRKLARDRLAEDIPSGLIFGAQYLAKSKQILGDDPFPYGVDANRKMIEAMIEGSYDQGLTSAKLKIDELFAASTLGL